MAASESSENPEVQKNQQHGLVVLATNSCIDLGFVLATFTAYLLYQIFGDRDLEWVWRLTLGLGSIFPLAVLFFRVNMKEPQSFTKNSMKEIPFFQLPWKV